MWVLDLSYAIVYLYKKASTNWVMLWATIVNDNVTWWREVEKIIISIVAFLVVNETEMVRLIVSTTSNKTTIFELGLIRLLLQVLLQQWNVMKMSDNRIYHSIWFII